MLHRSVLDAKKSSPRTDVFTQGLLLRSQRPMSGIPYIGGGSERLIEQSSETKSFVQLHVPVSTNISFVLIIYKKIEC